MQARSARTLKLEAALRRATENHELSLHFQPQVELRDGGLIGVEALLRWRHPDFGMISPAEFIPIAEASGLIIPIGDWVMRTALQQLLDWDRCGIAVPVVAVNLSAAQFRQEHLVRNVKNLLAETGVPPGRLEIELTESLMMDDPIAAVSVMDELHRAGIQLSIDDFGTGYSSLNHLKRFRIDKLKIDQSFVRDLNRDPEGEAIVRAIVSLAESLRFRTIAEGVETEPQLSFLRTIGCHEVQGYLFAKPMPAADLQGWIDAWLPSRAIGP
jgi:EAL domain-containing protein (putative c-di-GMP-specific phosphodiesterase class I)